MARLLTILMLVLLSATIAHAQEPSEAPEAPEPPEAPVTGMPEAFLVQGGSLRVGKDFFGEPCGSPEHLGPLGKGVGFLQADKQWHWRLRGELLASDSLFHSVRGAIDLCGRADVAPEGLPEIGTAGPCDASRGRDGSGMVTFHLSAGPVRFGPAPQESVSMSSEYRVSDVGWPATGSVMVVSGRTVTADGDPGHLLMLLQRRSTGWCPDKDGRLPGVGSQYPQGSSGAEIVGVAVVVPEVPAVQTPGCESWWGQVRRHLRGAGGGIHCPVPEEI